MTAQNAIPKTMCGAMLLGPEHIEIRETPVVPPGRGEILLRVRAATTCGTDVKVYRRGGHARMLTPPTLFGHEMAGEVARARAHLEDVAADERRKARTAEEAAMTQRRMAAMGELAAGIAHEINNPLGGMRNAVESLERGDIEPDRRARYLELVDGGLSRIQGIVGKLLRFTPRRDLSEQIFSYADAARDAVALIEHRASAEGVELVVELDGIGESYVRGDQSEIGQAALNLLQNALDALEEGCQGDSPRVVVDLKRDGEEQRLRIRDNGPGVEAERLGRLTDLFHTSKDVGRGTGLGLPLALHVASAHGGRLLLSSPPGEGFHAELCLPVAEETS